MNILDVAIRAVLVPLEACRGVSRKIIRCILVTQPFLPYSTSQEGLKWIWGTHRRYILISFRGVFWKFRQAPPSFYRDDPHPRNKSKLKFNLYLAKLLKTMTISMQNYKLKTDPYIKKTEKTQRWNKKEYQNLFVSYICLQKVRYSSLVCSCSVWDVFNSKTQPRLSLIFFLSSAFLGTTYLSPFHKWNVCFSCNILWGSNHFWRFRHICLHIQYYSYRTQATRRKKTH